MATPRRVTLNDVAAASGVSRSTAGFVLADNPNQTISAATRDRVRAAARELGYVPSGVARALREGSSRVVVLEVDWAYDGNYARSYIRGLDAELAAHGHVLMVRHGSHDDRATEQIVQAIEPRAVVRFGESYMTGHDLEDMGGGWRGGLAAHVALQIGHLAAHGHTHIALALPTAHSALTEARHRLTARHAQTLGLPAPVVVDLPSPRASGTAALRRLRGKHPQVTAIAAFTDEIALRALGAARDLGLSVPGDLAVIGFDDTEGGELSVPALTSVHIDAEVHGRRAARSLLNLDPGTLDPDPGHVVARESV
ncbi:LacI family DNA-binding transcriptional regulator [Actinospica durhamensis]|uniref:LacI family DNA-binding transcriptional regulator n=1 Tax=Actinospica durhamensis TaxID=1508375 RepID=A0A941EU31_9ACTN|nr:LacI family DNA-binding transcriptional regulator [Actinospica durhamensis]MBR7836478.1 LacI family DNA-binding transcriptional regulator [Actinospica durhamensis]